jgi:hypothetical protein
VDGWATARGEIRAPILERGWNERTGAFNFPQAFSHIGLINAAWAITQARQLASG